MAISFELDAKTKQRLKKLAMRTGKTLDTHLRELIAYGIEDLEDLYLAESTMHALPAARSRSTHQNRSGKILAWQID